VQVVAVDWSGAATGAGQRRHIWAAVARHGQLVELRNGRDRGEVIDSLVAAAQGEEELVVGLDFAFSFPAWFLGQHGLETVASLWDLVAREGEQWLRQCQTPFWGRPGRTRPVSSGHFRVTDSGCPPVEGIAPKSVFQIGGAGAVGTGSIRGMPYLRRLREAGFSIWPFDAVQRSTVIEMYPRLMTGPVVKSNGPARKLYLADWPMPLSLRRRAEDSEDAFDAAISALVMSQHLDALRGLEPASDPVTRLEGAIWVPPQHAGAASQHHEPQASATISYRPGGGYPSR
jgi:hypothetical protein